MAIVIKEKRTVKIKEKGERRKRPVESRKITASPHSNVAKAKRENQNIHPNHDLAKSREEKIASRVRSKTSFGAPAR